MAGKKAGSEAVTASSCIKKIYGICLFQPGFLLLIFSKGGYCRACRCIKNLYRDNKATIFFLYRRIGGSLELCRTNSTCLGGKHRGPQGPWQARRGLSSGSFSSASASWSGWCAAVFIPAGWPQTQDPSRTVRLNQFSSALQKPKQSPGMQHRTWLDSTATGCEPPGPVGATAARCRKR